MKISVIIPSYRPQAYLWTCLDALRAQTLPAADWEVCIVLNGPKEDYQAQIENYIASYPAYRWRLQYTAQAGVSNARNLGLQMAAGEYVCFIDDDDYVSPAYLQSLLTLAESSKAPLMPLSDVLCFHDGTQDFYEDHLGAAYRRIQNKDVVRVMQVRSFLSTPVAKIVRREYALAERFDPHFANGEDALYMFALSRFYHQYCAADPAAVYYRRVRPQSARHQLTRRLATMLPLMAAYLGTWLRHPWRYSFPFLLSRFVAIPKGIWDMYRAQRSPKK